jgi:hypothetical protein
MTATENHAAIVEFVKGTLGCRCPDSVFEKIETGSVDAGDSVRLARRIVVGDTLLVYIVVHRASLETGAGIGGLADLGRRDRDTHHYNRFRLVVADDGTSRDHDEVAACFARVAGSDEKMHIHFVSPETVQGF